jgi:hypothetical protein
VRIFLKYPRIYLKSSHGSNPRAINGYALKDMTQAMEEGELAIRLVIYILFSISQRTLISLFQEQGEKKKLEISRE